MGEEGREMQIGKEREESRAIEEESAGEGERKGYGRRECWRGRKGGVVGQYLACCNLRVREYVQYSFQHLHGLVPVLQLKVVVREEAQVHHTCILAVALQ